MKRRMLHIPMQIALYLACAVFHPAFAQTNCIPCDRPSTAALVPSMTGVAAQFAPRRAGTEVNARWKLPVHQDGWYQLTQPQLVAAGMPADQLIGSQIRLYTRTQEVAVLVSSTGLWSSADALHFYGVRHDGAYSRTNIYWLGLGGAGRRIGSVSGASLAGETLVTSACYSAVYDAKLLYRPFHQPLNTDIDHWFAALLGPSAATTIPFNTTNRVLGETANFRISLFGLSQQDNLNPDHRTRIQIGTNVFQPTYDDTVLLATNFFFDGSQLTNGSTPVSLIQNAVGASNDLAYLISARLDYVARISQRSASHEFCGRSGTNRYRIRDLTATNGCEVLDITDPFNPVRITDHTFIVTGAVTSIEFSRVTAGIPRFLFVQTNGMLAAATPTEIIDRNLRDTARSADYLMITPTALRHEAYRLARHRYTNGLSVAVAPIADVYDEFGYGVMDADAIKQFIGYAYHHWTPPRPRFALLIGEGTYDPLGYLGSIPTNNLPVKFGPSPFVVAPMDSWYGLVDGTTNGVDDSRPDVVVGRIAVSAMSVLSNVVRKTMAFDGANVVSNALLVSDRNEGINFKASSDTHISTNMNGFSKQFVAHELAGTFNQANTTNSINAGRRVVTYVGHGAVNFWSGANLLNVTNFPGLTNTSFSMFGIFSCQNGSFVDRSTNSLAEALIEVPRGASAVFAPTALSVQAWADYMAAGFTVGLAQQQKRYFGDVVRNAYLNLWAFNPDAAEMRTYQIFGDPGLLANRPGVSP